MAQFDVVVITLSFLLGLSMSQLLWATTAAVRARGDLKLHPLPFLWAGCSFFVHVQFWFATFAINTMIDQWTWSWYLQMLALGILLFASGALVLPSESQQRPGSLIDDFREHGRLGLIPLAAYHLCWLPTAYRLDGATLEAGNYANVALFVCAIVGFTSKQLSLQWVSGVAFALVVVWASVFVWTAG